MGHKRSDSEHKDVHADAKHDAQNTHNLKDLHQHLSDEYQRLHQIHQKQHDKSHGKHDDMSKEEQAALNKDWRSYLGDMNKHVQGNPEISKVLGSGDHSFQVLGLDNKGHVVTSSKGEHHYFDAKTQKEVNVAHQEGWGDPAKLWDKKSTAYRESVHIKVDVDDNGHHSFKGDGKTTYDDVIRSITQHQLKKAGVAMNMDTPGLTQYQTAIYEQLKQKHGLKDPLGVVPKDFSVDLDNLPEYQTKT